MGGAEKGTFQDELPAGWHPQTVPMKMSQHTVMFDLSPVDRVVFTSQSKSCLSGYECLRQHPQKCWPAGTRAWRAGRAARRVVSLPAAIHGQGNRKQAEKREEHPGALCDMAGESSTFQGPCIMHIAWDYVKPLCSSSLSRAKSSAGPGQFGGGECAATQMVTPGLQPPEEDLPCLPVPQSLRAFPTLLLALWRQVTALGSPARIQHQATA